MGNFLCVLFAVEAFGSLALKGEVGEREIFIFGFLSLTSFTKEELFFVFFGEGGRRSDIQT
jgi:hypothetical protein